MVQYKKKSAVDAGTSASIFDAVVGHFGPTLQGAVARSLRSVEISSLGATQVDLFRLADVKAPLRADQFLIECRP